MYSQSASIQLYEAAVEVGLVFSVNLSELWFKSLQTNPFDLFETFFGPNMGGFAGMDPTGFGTRRRTTVIRGDDIRLVKIVKI